MALSARIPDGSDLTGLCRHKLEGIFDMHGVKIGSRADISGFLEKLYNDRYFAMDFWALVESLEGMRDKISEEQIRRTVAECVGGWLPKGDPAVAGIDEAFAAHFASRGGSAAEAQPSDAGLRIIEHIENSEFKDSMQGTAVAGEQWQPIVELGAAAASGGLGRIDQILSRLELNDHELKLLLENIENRISRLEPHVEELTAQVVGPRGSAAKRRAIQEHGRLAADRVGQQLAATNIAVGIWGTRIFGQMDSGLEKVGRRVSAIDVAVATWRSQLITSGELVLARMVKAEERGRAAARGMKQCWAAAMNWVEHHRAMLVHVSTTLGVVACLALVIWLWGRPHGYMVRATPVAASSTAPVPTAPVPTAVVPTPAVPTPVVPTTAVKADAESAPQEPVGRGEDTSPTAAASVRPEEVEQADGAASGVQRVSAKATVAKGSYTAPPWIKWYGDDGTEQATVTAAQGAKTQAPVPVESAAPAGESVQPAKRRTR